MLGMSVRVAPLRGHLSPGLVRGAWVADFKSDRDYQGDE